MRNFLTIELDSVEKVKEQLLLWSATQDTVTYFENKQDLEFRTNPNTHSSVECMVAVGKVDELRSEEKDAFAKLKAFSRVKQDWLIGYLAYDLKNDTENLESNNYDGLDFPALNFFVPRFIIFFEERSIRFAFLPQFDSEQSVEELFSQIIAFEANLNEKQEVELKPRFSQEEYIRTVAALQNHIQIGDIYEANLCQEFYGENTELNPALSFIKLRQKSPAPFMSFFKNENLYLMSASPERFLKKTGPKLISQPMKGTSKRSADSHIDTQNKLHLQQDKKERAENIMIVDLVRNDLTRVAKRATVKVDELCEVYSFRTVHQMISTVSAQLADDKDYIDAIKASFPMGSMTGAPKIRAMKLIERYERTKRGLFSGAIGYVTPWRDFDFNVVIRSLLYNAETKYLSLQVGSAITSLANAESEYEECLLKAESLLSIFEKA